MVLQVLIYLRCCYLIIFLLLSTLITIHITWDNYRSFKVNETCCIFGNVPVRHLERTSVSNDSSCQRAILVFYPSNQENYYLPELRWLFRSWIETIKFELNQCRTDLIIFTEKSSSALIHLGCVVNHIRRDRTEPAQCRIIPYLRVSSRIINPLTKQQQIFLNEHLQHRFHVNHSRSILLYEQLRTYQYIDSVNILAEGYPVYAHYDWILKTDLGVFLTRPVAGFQPNSSKVLYMGRGGYSTEFNTRQLGRIARDMGWKYHNLTNVGSTWYGSPDLAHRISTFTLDAMLYLAQNEFTPVERQQKLAALLWPDWHYGVLSMYGSHLAVNHLIVSDRMNIQNGDQLLDQPTTNSNPNDIEIHHHIHLHCWHTEEQFSKFHFKANRYNHLDPSTLINNTSPKGYAMRMALESRSLSLEQLGQYFRDIRSRQYLSSSNKFFKN